MINPSLYSIWSLTERDKEMLLSHRAALSSTSSMASASSGHQSDDTEYRSEEEEEEDMMASLLEDDLSSSSAALFAMYSPLDALPRGIPAYSKMLGHSLAASTAHRTGTPRSPLVVPAGVVVCEPFFGQDNANPRTIVVGRSTLKTPVAAAASSYSLALAAMGQIQSRFTELRADCNNGYGVVPISNTFTDDGNNSSSSWGGAEEEYYEFDLRELPKDVLQWTTCKKSGKCSNPPTPRPPADKNEPLLLFQIGFPSGRQGIFQGTSRSLLGEPVAELVGQYVVLAQDDGVDIGILRGFEPLPQLVRRIPEVPFMPILRRALAGEIDRILHKTEDEQIALAICRELLQVNPKWRRGMVVESCEFQYDRHKLVVYAEMRGWLNFNSFVKAVHTSLKAGLRQMPRVFIQRRFKD